MKTIVTMMNKMIFYISWPECCTASPVETQRKTSGWLTALFVTQKSITKLYLSALSRSKCKHTAQNSARTCQLGSPPEEQSKAEDRYIKYWVGYIYFPVACHHSYLF